VAGSPYTITCAPGTLAAPNYSFATGSTANFTIDPASTTTALASSANPSALGANVTFTATVTPSGATGTIQFYADGATLGSSVTLSGGEATVSTAALLAGTHTITATYSGDTNHSGSNGLLTPDQAVGQGATTTSLVSSANPSVVGSSVTFTATVATVAPPGATGTVQFYVDGATLGGPVTLLSGEATASTSALAAGTHVITATYSGDLNHTGSNGRLVPDQVVNKIATTTSLASSANPSGFGSSVIFTATVAPSAATGSVQFFADGVTLGSAVSLSGGVASFSTSTLAVGTRVITATYTGDGNYATSTGTLSPDQVVNKATTNTSLTSSANPSVFGSSVTFTATVAPSAATGSVQFYADGVTQGSAVSLLGGVASFSTSALTIGTHVITATYGGDVNYVSSTGTLVPDLVVNARIYLPLIMR
jgi:hypothetical protein